MKDRVENYPQHILEIEYILRKVIKSLKDLVEAQERLYKDVHNTHRGDYGLEATKSFLREIEYGKITGKWPTFDPSINWDKQSEEGSPPLPSAQKTEAEAE